MSSPADFSTLDRSLHELARRHGFSADAVSSLFGSIVHGGGGMAQFDHPEFSGAGQWMQGGMTMVSDMFNHTLKHRVAALCADLSALLADQPKTFADDRQSRWWPAGLGSPSSSGSQNDIRYAWFGDASRLAVEARGELTLYDTLDHRIGGISQQQSGGSTLRFTSQYGVVELATLPVVGSEGREPVGAGARPGHAVGANAPAETLSQEIPAASVRPSEQQAGTRPHDAIDVIARLAGLREEGVLTDDEFSAKKAELLSRL